MSKQATLEAMEEYWKNVERNKQEAQEALEEQQLQIQQLQDELAAAQSAAR